MSIPEADLLDDNMQTYEEFRAQVDQQVYGINPQTDNPAGVIREEIIIAFPKISTAEGIQIFPAS